MPDALRVSAPALDGDTDADVAIIGGGLTGLWTAWSILERDPTIRVRLLERATIGFGASGRNGGWCSALLPMSLPKLERRHGRAPARRFHEAMIDTVRDVGRFVADREIDCWHAQGGSISMARNKPQVTRLQHELETYRSFGFGEDDYRWLDVGEARAACAADGVLGALTTPHCAAVHPLRLTHGVAAAVIGAGGAIHEGTTVTSIRPGKVTTDRGVVRADVIVQATEGYTPQLPGQRRRMLPIYSMMIATEPLSSDTWDRIGLADRPTFDDGRHMIIYGQRTGDDRLAFGGRGAPYHFGSAIRDEFDTDDDVRTLLTTGLVELFPTLADTRVTHHWGGVLGAPRDWTCSVRFDRTTGLAMAGGYVGDGVATTRLAGRTLAALITSSTDAEDLELVRLPLVGHRSRSWEPEPLRWLGVNGARAAARRADAHEDATGSRSRIWGDVIDRLLGR